jgi:hypothetical protein
LLIQINTRHSLFSSSRAQFKVAGIGNLLCAGRLKRELVATSSRPFLAGIKTVIRFLHFAQMGFRSLSIDSLIGSAFIWMLLRETMPVVA